MSKVEITRASGARFAFVLAEGTGQRVGLLFENGFAGLSAFANVMTITSLANQSAFEEANPLQKGGRVHDALSFGSAISALTVDLFVLARGAVNLGSRGINLLPVATAAKLAPGLSSGAETLGRLLTGKLAAGLIAIANLAGAVVSAWDAWNAARAGRTGEAVGHAMVALGSVIFFAGAAASLFAGAGASAGTVVGLPVAAVLAALGLILAGVGLIFWFQKGPFENLLHQCFWGTARNYAFWDDSRRDPIHLRIRRALMSSTTQGGDDLDVHSAYRAEVQEFMNFFYMPSVEIERMSGWPNVSSFTFGASRDYTLVFILPQFAHGRSEVIASVLAFAERESRSRRLPPLAPNAALTEIFQTAMQSALASATEANVVNGALRLVVRVNFPRNCSLLWVYEPIPNTFVPMRMLDDDRLIGHITPEGLADSTAYGFLGEDVR